jgi:hypothetical protein
MRSASGLGPGRIIDQQHFPHSSLFLQYRIEHRRRAADVQFADMPLELVHGRTTGNAIPWRAAISSTDWSSFLASRPVGWAVSRIADGNGLNAVVVMALEKSQRLFRRLRDQSFEEMRKTSLRIDLGVSVMPLDFVNQLNLPVALSIYT